MKIAEPTSAFEIVQCRGIRRDSKPDVVQFVVRARVSSRLRVFVLTNEKGQPTCLEYLPGGRSVACGDEITTKLQAYIRKRLTRYLEIKRGQSKGSVR